MLLDNSSAESSASFIKAHFSIYGGRAKVLVLQMHQRDLRSLVKM